MIFINPTRISLSYALRSSLAQLTKELNDVPSSERAKFIESKRKESWGSKEIVDALKEVVGNKCWYSEVVMTGFDPNVDHFRPKNRVVEVDDNFEKTSDSTEGYWWLAFEILNYRLCSQHTNQRRVDESTAGGKADFFPVIGPRAPEGTAYLEIEENILPLDPCSTSDVDLLWFDPEGNPICCSYGIKKAEDEKRVKTTIWLYHLNKYDLVSERSKVMHEVRMKLSQANAFYRQWKNETPCLKSKKSFDKEISEIEQLISEKSRFAGAKRSAIKSSMAEYDWIENCRTLIT